MTKVITPTQLEKLAQVSVQHLGISQDLLALALAEIRSFRLKHQELRKIPESEHFAAVLYEAVRKQEENRQGPLFAALTPDLAAALADYGEVTEAPDDIAAGKPVN